MGDTASATSIIIVISDTLEKGGRVYGGNLATVSAEDVTATVGEFSGEVEIVKTDDQDACEGTAVVANGAFIGVIAIVVCDDLVLVASGGNDDDNAIKISHISQ